MNYYIIASLLLCFVGSGRCLPVPPACELACALRQDRQYMHRCTSAMDYCTICRDYFCPQVIPTWWTIPFAQGNWNPHTVKKCDNFPSNVKAKCTNDKHVSSKCELSCARGYLPSPELYKGYGNKRWSYTHDEVMSFSVTCGYTADGSSVAWSRSEFSCVAKEQIIEIFFPVEPIKMMTRPTSPYPEEYMLKVFNSDFKDDVENGAEASGGGGRTLSLYQHCYYACSWENGGYRFGCQQVTYYSCFSCRLTGYCASTRSFAG